MQAQTVTLHILRCSPRTFSPLHGARQAGADVGSHVVEVTPPQRLLAVRMCAALTRASWGKAASRWGAGGAAALRSDAGAAGAAVRCAAASALHAAAALLRSAAALCCCCRCRACCCAWLAVCARCAAVPCAAVHAGWLLCGCGSARLSSAAAHEKAAGCCCCVLRAAARHAARVLLLSVYFRCTVRLYYM
jgi:GNAT superfamily N-acetyltransferase